MILGMEPQDQAMLELHRNGYASLEALRLAFFQSPQARQLYEAANPTVAATAPTVQNYVIPPFLLRRPASAAVPWHFAEPTLEQPETQLCTAEQMEGDYYRALCRRMALDSDTPHRKTWEFAFILSVLQSKGMVAPGRRGLGFGTGQEPLPSTLAHSGVAVVASDAPGSADVNALWAQSAQWSQSLDELWHPELVDRGTFFDNVQFRPVDMNVIPDDLRGFDFCWSACCFEHLGSIRHGLDFLRNCLATLRPGGVSVHTTEFNLGSNGATLEAPELVLFRKQDIETVIEELVEDGHSVAPLNLWPGATPVDEHIDLPPYSIPHLKLELGGYCTTSIGIVVTKKM
jgi:2-polyprenyl-3-methyl-5-hydroxy-6-metoxy-1,4-benzoquinol methylase